MFNSQFLVLEKCKPKHTCIILLKNYLNVLVSKESAWILYLSCPFSPFLIKNLEYYYLILFSKLCQANSSQRSLNIVRNKNIHGQLNYFSLLQRYNKLRFFGVFLDKIVLKSSSWINWLLQKFERMKTPHKNILADSLLLLNI